MTQHVKRDAAGAGETIKRLRQEAGLSLAGLARLSGVSKSYLALLEAGGGQRPSAEKLGGLARALSVSIEELLGSVEDRAAPSRGLVEFAEAAGLSPAERNLLASIKFPGPPPRTARRWQYLWDAWRASQIFDDEELSPTSAGQPGSWRVTPAELFVGQAPSRDDYVLNPDVAFPYERWQAQLPALVESADLGGLGGHVTRRGVFALAHRFRDAPSAQSAAELMLTAYVWGSGNDPRAISHGARLFGPDNWRDLADRLLHVALETLDDDPAGAYGLLAPGGKLHLAGLGSSFASKFCYFAGYDFASTAYKPLILDHRVASTLGTLTGEPWDSRYPWKAASYERYLELAASWARDWQTEPDVVERRLWDLGRQVRR